MSSSKSIHSPSNDSENVPPNAYVQNQTETIPQSLSASDDNAKNEFPISSNTSNLENNVSKITSKTETSVETGSSTNGTIHESDENTTVNDKNMSINPMNKNTVKKLEKQETADGEKEQEEGTTNEHGNPDNKTTKYTVLEKSCKK